MRYELYSVKDNVTGQFAGPFLMVNEAAARRSFKDACADMDSEMGHNPQDFDLYRLGGFDTETGGLDANPEFLQRGVQAR